ncbi:MAG: MarR family winged helix-turn-helix transcriptional regulator [Planctomycetaceae bacterium]|nr:MarR family winged helix-turn-helix transcriptional regulator [Planctomycetaceae bacterium]
MYDFTRAFHILFRRAVAYHTKDLKDLGCNSGYIPYLMCVESCPGITQDGVAEKISVDKSTVAKMIRRLVEEGYIARSVDGDDKRAYNLSITAKGEGILPQVHASAHKFNRHLTRTSPRWRRRFWRCCSTSYAINEGKTRRIKNACGHLPVALIGRFTIGFLEHKHFRRWSPCSV